MLYSRKIIKKKVLLLSMFQLYQGKILIFGAFYDDTQNEKYFLTVWAAFRILARAVWVTQSAPVSY